MDYKNIDLFIEYIITEIIKTLTSYSMDTDPILIQILWMTVNHYYKLHNIYHPPPNCYGEGL